MAIPPPLRLVSLLTASLLLCVAATACGSDDASPTPSSTVAVTATQPASPPAAPAVASTPAPLLQSSGWLVYLRGRDLYVGDLATGAEQRLTTGSLGAGYAGYARIGDAVWLYFTSLSAIHGDNEARRGTFDVYRQRLGAANGELLFSFDGGWKSVEFAGTNASA